MAKANVLLNNLTAMQLLSMFGSVCSTYATLLSVQIYFITVTYLCHHVVSNIIRFFTYCRTQARSRNDCERAASQHRRGCFSV